MCWIVEKEQYMHVDQRTVQNFQKVTEYGRDKKRPVLRAFLFEFLYELFILHVFELIIFIFIFVITTFQSLFSLWPSTGVYETR